jgi:hypothetical protein
MIGQMKRVLIFSTVLFGLVILFFSFNQWAVNSYDSKPCLSASVEKSKEKNLYLGEYIPLKDSIHLKHGPIPTLTIWAERAWTDGHSWFIFSKIIPQNGVNIVLPCEVENRDTNDFMIEPAEKYFVHHFGGLPDFGYGFFYNDYPDTLMFYIKQRKHASWQEPIISDSVVYVRGY